MIRFSGKAGEDGLSRNFSTFLVLMEVVLEDVAAFSRMVFKGGGWVRK